jgi:KaiC/GvpD/RAD55 family RecA-like ATPase
MSKDLTREELLAKRKADRASKALLPAERPRDPKPERVPDGPPPGHPAYTGDAGDAGRSTSIINVNGSGRHLQRKGWHQLGDIEADVQLVKGLIGTNQLIVLYGESGSGKSFLAFDFAAHIALSRAWQGHAVATGGVLYVASEGRGGWSKRVEAFCQHHAIDEETRVMIPFQFVLESVNLGRNGGIDVAAVIEAAQLASTEFGRPVRVIIVDTMARAMPGSNENDPVDMGAFVMSVDKIREVTGATVIIVHHSGKNASLGARGHSSLRAAVDTELEVERTDAGRLLRVRKSRDGDDGFEMAFKLDVVEVGRDAEDQPITSCIIAGVDQDEHQKAKAAKAKKKSQWQLGADYLTNTLTDFPETVGNNTALPSGIPVTTTDRFRDALIRASIIDGESDATRRQQWKRIKDALITKGVMRIEGQYCWRADWKAAQAEGA